MIATIMLAAVLAATPNVERIKAGGVAAVVEEDGTFCFSVMRPILTVGEDGVTEYRWELVPFRIGGIAKWATEEEKQRELLRQKHRIFDAVANEGLASMTVDAERNGPKKCIDCGGGGYTMITYYGLRDAVGFCFICEGHDCVVWCRSNEFMTCPPQC